MTRGVLRIGVLLGSTIVASAVAAPVWAQSGTGVSAAGRGIAYWQPVSLNTGL